MNAIRMPHRSLIASALFLLAACGQDLIEPGGRPPVASVTVAPTADTLMVGDTVRLVATVKDAAGTVLNDRVVNWMSSNPSVTTVSATGLVTGMQADTQRVTITATTENVSGSATIAVIAAPPPLSISVVPPTASLLTGGSQDFTATVANDPTNRGVTWSITAISASGQIAFTSTRDGQGEIYVMNADGSGVTRLTNNPAIDESPAWSPDGMRIAFVSTRDGNNKIYVMNADGSGLRNLTNHPAFDIAPAWRPQQGSLAQTARQRTRTQ